MAKPTIFYEETKKKSPPPPNLRSNQKFHTTTQTTLQPLSLIKFQPVAVKL